MIQRIQTVYLVLGVAALVAVIVLIPGNAGVSVEAQGWFVPVVCGLAGLAALVAGVAIFLYKDRPRQRGVIVGAQILTVLHTGAFYAGLFLGDALYVNTAAGIDWGRLTLLVLPLMAYLLFLLARRGVAKDIALVKSMDRLR